MYETLYYKVDDSLVSASNIVYKMLLKNQLWQSDKDLLVAILKDNNRTLQFGFKFVDLLSEKELHRYPEIINALIDYRGTNFDHATFTQQLMQPEWAEHPEVLHKLLDTNGNRLLKDIVGLVLTVPAWAKHPELLEKYLAVMRGDGVGLTAEGDKKNIEKLLALPHWKNLPEYQKLAEGKPLYYETFKRYVLAKAQPERRTFLQNLGACTELFKSIFKH